MNGAVPHNSKTLVESLNAKIVAGQNSYYSGEPTMTDPEYDALEAQLTALVKTDPSLAKYATALKTVGDVKSNSTTRIKHERPMLSIENYYTKESFFEASKNYGTWVLVEPKFDGCSAELTYIDGKLTRAVSRGDGTSGEDMTSQVKACKKIPQNIITNIHDLRIRGEIVMRNSELARLNALGGKQHANTRNLVSGTLKQQDLTIVRSREMILFPWDMYSPTEDNFLSDSAYDRMKLAFNFGFPHPEGMKVKRDLILSELDRVLKNIENSDITADGVVIKADSHIVRNKLGVSSKYTNFQNCFKPQNLAAETTLEGIEYGLGRTGKVTPVALLKPVNLGGAMIARASVCNETYMANLGLKIGCTVKILRSGDVIPYIVEVVNSKGGKEIVFPTKCPSCGSKLAVDPESEIVQRFCENSSCPGKAVEQFAYVGHRDTLEIDNLGDSMAAELVELDVTDLADLFEFGNKSLLSAASFTVSKQNDLALASSFVNQGFRSGVNTVKMVKSLEEQAKTATWDRWLAAISIPFIGHSLGKDISKLLNLTSDDMKNLPKLLLKLPSMNMNKLGEVKTAAILNWAKDSNNVSFCNRLYKAGVRPTPLAAPKKVAGAKLADVNFCITGSFSRGSRPIITAELEKLGATAHSSVTKSINLLIVGDDAGSKVDKAKKLGVKMVGADWLSQVLGA